eukprot:jgi/Botrbrau1/19803/Bobra.0124s0049.3
MIDDGVWTITSAEQILLEDKVIQLRSSLLEEPLTFDDVRLRLKRDQHVLYLQNDFQSLAAGFVTLDASRTWMVYWVVHALALLEAPLPRGVTQRDVADFVATCQDADGGFAGGPGQFPHLAPTYAGVLALVTVGGEYALRVVDRSRLWAFLNNMAIPPSRGGGFALCKGGEIDVRGCYTSMAVAHILGLDKDTLAERAGMLAYIRQCQTYEGGLGGRPGNEAHGGYTFCGLAALMLIDRADVLDLPSLLRWVVNRQGPLEGGFMGRTNKLVDGCYSFWQAGLFPLLQRLQPELLRQTGNPATPPGLLRTALGVGLGVATAPARLVAGGLGRLATMGRRGSGQGEGSGSSAGKPPEPVIPELPAQLAVSPEAFAASSSDEAVFCYQVFAGLRPFLSLRPMHGQRESFGAQCRTALLACLHRHVCSLSWPESGFAMGVHWPSWPVLSTSANR